MLTAHDLIRGTVSSPRRKLAARAIGRSVESVGSRRTPAAGSHPGCAARGAFALLVGLGAAAGCNDHGPPDGTLFCDNEQSLVIEHFAVVDPMSMCRADPAAMFSLSFGVWDAGLVQLMADRTARGYLLAPVVRNNLPDRSTATTVQRDSVQIIGFNVRLETPGGTELSHSFIAAAGGTVDPAGGKAAVMVEVVPPSALPLADGKVVVHLQPVGTRAGSYLYGGCSKFPVYVCHLCLASDTAICNPLDPSSPGCSSQAELPPCPQGGYAQDQIALGGCFAQQDALITCCIQGFNVLCGSKVPKSM